MFVDIVGFSAMMSRDDEATTARVVGFHRRVDSMVGDHHGRVVATAGDSVFAVFDSIVEAVECAAALQRTLAADGDDLIMVRIGMHFGDVLIEGDDLSGDGVNIAARLEELAPPGGIAVSDVVYQEVRGRLPFTDAGPHTLKNIDRKVRVYRVSPTAFGYPESALAVVSDRDDLDDLDLNIEGLDGGIVAARDVAAIIREQLAARGIRRGSEDSDADGLGAPGRPTVPRPAPSPSGVLSSAGFWVRVTGGSLLLASRPSGWTDNGLYPLVGSILVAGALAALIAALSRKRSVAAAATRGRAFAIMVSAVGLAAGGWFLDGTVSRAIVWISAAAIGGPALITMIKGTPRRAGGVEAEGG